MDTQSSTALLIKARRETLLTLPQISFLALYSGNSGKLVTLCGNYFLADSFGCQVQQQMLGRPPLIIQMALHGHCSPLFSLCLTLPAFPSKEMLRLERVKCPSGPTLCVRHWPGC